MPKQESKTSSRSARVLRLIAAVTVLISGTCAQQAPEPNIHLLGAARLLNDRLRITPARPQLVGAVWFSPKQPVTAGFEVSFRFQLTEQGGLGPGADGFAFVLQSQGLDALAGRGSAGGFALGDGWHDASKPGIPRSVAVFFDTYENMDAHDPSDNYIAICTNGPISKMRWPPQRLAVGKHLKVRLKDRRIHKVRIHYKPPVMTVYLDDGEPKVSAPVDLSTVVDASGSSYVGLTASTGNGWQNHDILDWSFKPTIPDASSDVFVVHSDIQFLKTYCLAGKNLCTPAEAIVEPRGSGRFHIVLPAHLEWGASIPNASGLTVSISNARGSACWGTDECFGPGVLITKTIKGRTWFSMTAPTGSSLKSGQGFFEFDVELK